LLHCLASLSLLFWECICMCMSVLSVHVCESERVYLDWIRGWNPRENCFIVLYPTRILVDPASDPVGVPPLLSRPRDDVRSRASVLSARAIPRRDFSFVPYDRPRVRADRCRLLVNSAITVAIPSEFPSAMIVGTLCFRLLAEELILQHGEKGGEYSRPLWSLAVSRTVFCARQVLRQDEERNRF